MKQFISVNNKSKFIFCTYIWGANNINKISAQGLTYLQQLQRLMSDCEKHSINYHFKVFDVKNANYQSLINHKIEFIKKMVLKYPNFNCIYLDSDIQVINYPLLFEEPFDMFVINYSPYESACKTHHLIRIPGGVIGFGKKNNKVLALLDFLIAKIKEHPHDVEDLLISAELTLSKIYHTVRLCELPEEYLFMQLNNKVDSKGRYTKINKLTPRQKKTIVLYHEDTEARANNVKELNDQIYDAMDKAHYNYVQNLYSGVKCGLTDVRMVYDWTNSGKYKFHVISKSLARYKLPKTSKTSKSAQVSIGNYLNSSKDLYRVPLPKHNKEVFIRNCLTKAVKEKRVFYFTMQKPK